MSVTIHGKYNGEVLAHTAGGTWHPYCYGPGDPIRVGDRLDVHEAYRLSDGGDVIKHFRGTVKGISCAGCSIEFNDVQWLHYYFCSQRLGQGESPKPGDGATISVSWNGNYFAPCWSKITRLAPEPEKRLEECPEFQLVGALRALGADAYFEFPGFCALDCGDGRMRWGFDVQEGQWQAQLTMDGECIAGECFDMSGDLASDAKYLLHFISYGRVKGDA